MFAPPGFFAGNADDSVCEGIAMGGTIYEDGDYKYHVFETSGRFRVCGVPDVLFEILLVAGGGAGGGYFGGGGGGGGVIYETDFSISAGTYPILIGNGGAAGELGLQGISGNNTTGFGLTAVGGGRGGLGGDSGFYPPSSGGSGGGGASSLGSADGGSGTAGQGYAGGIGGPVDGQYNSAGGGGASAVGTDSSAVARGNGGDGLEISITGAPVVYGGGGGGGGGSVSGGIGGAGGGGAGGRGDASNGLVLVDATPGMNGLGGGGGGGGVGVGTPGFAAHGGRGVAIIRYRFQGDDGYGSSLVASCFSGLTRFDLLIASGDPTGTYEIQDEDGIAIDFGGSLTNPVYHTEGDATLNESSTSDLWVTPVVRGDTWVLRYLETGEIISEVTLTSCIVYDYVTLMKDTFTGSGTVAGRAPDTVGDGTWSRTLGAYGDMGTGVAVVADGKVTTGNTGLARYYYGGMAGEDADALLISFTLNTNEFTTSETDGDRGFWVDVSWSGDNVSAAMLHFQGPSPGLLVTTVVNDIDGALGQIQPYVSPLRVDFEFTSNEQAFFVNGELIRLTHEDLPVAGSFPSIRFQLQTGWDLTDVEVKRGTIA